MNNYKKPVVLMNEELAEGVYAASGSVVGDCWSLGQKTTQDWNGQAHVYEISAVHTKAVAHFSEALTIKFTFSATITNAWAEGAGNYTVEGIGSNTLTVTRTHHANGEYSGDNVTFKLFVVAGNEAGSKAVSMTSEEFVSCDKHTTPNYNFID